jgi:hypothetical protein
MMPSSKLDDIHFHWWTQTLPTQRATITGRWLDAALTVPYAGGGLDGAVIYFQMAAADTVHFRQGLQVLLRDASDYNVDVNAYIDDVVVNGAASYIATTLIEADDNSLLGDLRNCDVALVNGSINPQGGTRPESITLSPEEFSNYTQIFRTPLEIARTLMQTKLRTQDAYLKAKMDILQLHGLQMEKAFIWGVQSVHTGINGKPQTTTQGIVPTIKTFGTVQDFSIDPAADYTGKTWLQAGDAWLSEHLEEIFRFGSGERLCYCGSGALLGIDRLVKALGLYTIQPREMAFGIQVKEWITPFGVMYMQRHPLFSYEVTNRNSMLLIEPKNFEYRFIQDTMFTPDVNFGKGGGDGLDGKREEYLTECGLEFHHPETGGFLNGIGIDNIL